MISFRIDWFDLAILHAHNLHILLDRGGPRSWDSRELVNGDPWFSTAKDGDSCWNEIQMRQNMVLPIEFVSHPYFRTYLAS